MLKITSLIFLIALSFQSLAVCDFANNKCPVKPKFKKFLTKKFKRLGTAPLEDPMDGINMLTVKEAAALVGNKDYIFVDNRPADYFNKCRIKGAVNYLYGVPTTPTNTLNQAIAKGFITEGKTIVYYCNSPKCYRALNASIQSYAWGIPKEKIKWFGKGVVGAVNDAAMGKLMEGGQCHTFKKK